MKGKERNASSSFKMESNATERASEFRGEGSHLPRASQSARGLSFGAGLMTFMKAMLGAGMLSLPKAFSNSGIVGGVAIYMLCGIVCTYTEVLLIQTKQSVESRDSTVQTYGAVAQAVLGHRWKYITTALVVALEWAFCSGMLIVIGSTANTLIEWLSARAAILCTVPISILLCSFRFLKDMWLIATGGVFVYLFGVVGTMYYFGFTDGDALGTHRKLIGWRYLLSMAGTSVYSLEGINLVLPVESALGDGSQGRSVIVSGMLMIVAVNGSFGAFGYMFGFGDCDVVTDCLPSGWLSAVVQVSLIITLLFTIPVNFYPATEMIEEYVFAQDDQLENEKSTRKCATRVKKEIGRFVLRSAQIILFSGIAMLVPDLDLFTALLGSLGVSVIGFVIPPLLYNIHFHPSLPVMVLNYALMGFGIAFCIFGTTFALIRIVDEFSS